MTSLETVTAYYDAFNSRNWNEMLALVDDNIKHEPNQGKPRIGKALFTDFMQHMDESYAETLKDIVLFSSTTEGRIAAEFTVHGTYKKRFATGSRTGIHPSGSGISGSEKRKNNPGYNVLQPGIMDRTGFQVK
ncbi:SnoaL-like domain protein [compost metagenome]